MHDLRSFIASAEKSAELLRVERETDPLTEMGVLFGETEIRVIGSAEARKHYEPCSNTCNSEPWA